MNAIIFCGIQGSGKSTFYRERFFDTHVRIRLDVTKTRHRENALLYACIAAQLPFVVDNTNIKADARGRYRGSPRLRITSVRSIISRRIRRRRCGGTPGEWESLACRRWRY